MTVLYHTYGKMSSVKLLISTAVAVLYNLYFVRRLKWKIIMEFG